MTRPSESTEAILAAVSAPIPFVLALLVVGVGMCFAVQWAYVRQLDKAKKSRDQAIRERERLKAHRQKLKDENKIKADKIAELEKEQALQTSDGKDALAELADSQKRTDETLGEFGDDRLETNLDARSASTIKTK